METHDRVRENTAEQVNAQLDAEMAARVKRFENSTPDEITRRIEELDAEWDMERLLETNASLLAFSGLVLGMTHS